MSRFGKIFSIATLILSMICSLNVMAQKTAHASKFKIGAYYYDGWTGKTKQSMTKLLLDSFPEREPIWGWVTSTPEVMQKQIGAAATSGLSFFSFCWYYNAKPDTSDVYALNNALRLFIGAPNSKKLDFCLLVANHEGYEIGPKDWGIVCNRWIKLFKNSNYLTLNEKPLIIFYSIKTLLNNFGSVEAVKKAMLELRALSVANGLKGITIAGCMSGEQELMDAARSCGFDFLTGYNYHHLALKKDQKIIPVDTLSEVSKRAWDGFRKSSPLPYIPVATLNWDPRPWAKPNNYYSTSPRFTGYSGSSVYKSVKGLTDWISANPDYTSKERIGLLYAWNEYGEGAWLTPSKKDQHLLKGLKRALEGK